MKTNTDNENNPFLSRLMANIRHPRPKLPEDQPFFNRIEKVPAGLYGEIWFRTGGCRWDRQGGCTMCNYGTATPPSSAAMVTSVEQALAALNQPIDELMVSPSGSFLDALEVPVEARHRIYDLIAAYPASMVLLESRSEWVVQETVAELRNSQPSDRHIVIEIGLESVDPWIRRFCINKGSSIADFTRAVQVARDQGVEVYANVCLGTALLSPAEAIDDTVKTARWSLDQGAARVVIFPLHIKPYTLLEVLHQRGDYAAPSLWSLVEVLNRLGSELMPRVEIAWYRSYYDREDKIRHSPDTCPHCRAAVLKMLDEYRATQASCTIADLSAYPCSCRELWATSLNAVTGDIVDRVAATYRDLAKTFNLDTWLTTRGAFLMGALYSKSHLENN